MTTAQLHRYCPDFLCYCRDVKVCAPHTIAAYERDLAQFQQWMLAMEPGEAPVSAELVSRYIHHQIQKRKLSACSLNRALSALRSFIKYLVVIHSARELQRLLPHIQSVRGSQRLPHTLSVDAINAAMPAPVDFTRARDGALIELLYSTGCRVSELLSITVAQFLSSRGSIIIRGKGGREREVYIGTRAQDAVTAYLPFRARIASRHNGAPPHAAAHKSAAPHSAPPLTHHSAKMPNPHPSTPPPAHDRLFINRHGGALTRQGVNFILKKYHQAIAFQKPVSAHLLRHTFATHMLDSGGDVRIVQELLGHATLSATEIYTHVSSAKMQQAYRRAHPHGRRHVTERDGTR